MTPRLPVWGFTVGTYGFVFRHLLTMVRLALPALSVLVVSQAVAMALVMVPMGDMMEAVRVIIEQTHDAGQQLSEEEIEALSASFAKPMMSVMAGQAVAALSLLAVVAMAATAWCRFAALGDDREGSWFAFRFGPTEIEMLGALLVLGIGGFGAFVVIVAASAALVAAVGFAGQIVMAVLVTALVLAFCRFSMLLPQVAVGGGLSPIAAWRRTRGQTLRLFAIYGLLGLPLMAVALALMVGTLIILAALSGFLEGTPLSHQQVLEIMGGWESATGITIFAGLNAVYPALNGLMLALTCVTMGLAHARLVERPADAFL